MKFRLATLPMVLSTLVFLLSASSEAQPTVDLCPDIGPLCITAKIGDPYYDATSYHYTDPEGNESNPPHEGYTQVGNSPSPTVEGPGPDNSKHTLTFPDRDNPSGHIGNMAECVEKVSQHLDLLNINQTCDPTVLCYEPTDDSGWRTKTFEKGKDDCTGCVTYKCSMRLEYWPFIPYEE